MIEVAIMRLANGQDLPLPAYETAGAAGMDLRAAEAIVLKPGARCLLPTGIAIALPQGSVKRFMKDIGNVSVQSKFPRILDDDRKNLLRSYIAS